MTRNRAIIYARLSPSPRDGEAKGGNIAEQVAICQARCDSEGWEVVAVFDQDVDTSATSKKARAGWRKAVAMVADGGADIIIGRQYERLYRRPQDLNELCDIAEKYHITLVAAMGGERVDLTSAEGRMQARIRADFAAFETEQKVERQLLGHGRRVAAGRPFWNTRPFGFEKDATHRVGEAGLLREAYNNVLAKHSLWSIADRWNKAGVLTTQGNLWTTSSLRQTLIHPRNAGIHTYTPRKAWENNHHLHLESGSEAIWEPIVSPEVYRAVCSLLGDPERRTGGGGKRKGLLVHIVQCGKEECGAWMGQAWGKPRSDGTRLRKYVCRGCRGTIIPADWADNYVIWYVIMHADEIVAKKLAGGEVESALSTEEIASLRAEAVRIEQGKKELSEDRAMGLIDRASLIAGVRKADERLSEIDALLTEAAVEAISAERWRGDIEAMFANLDPEQEDDQESLREVIQDACSHVKVLPRGKGVREPRPEHMDIAIRK